MRKKAEVFFRDLVIKRDWNFSRIYSNILHELRSEMSVETLIVFYLSRNEMFARNNMVFHWNDMEISGVFSEIVRNDNKPRDFHRLHH